MRGRTANQEQSISTPSFTAVVSRQSQARNSYNRYQSRKLRGLRNTQIGFVGEPEQPGALKARAQRVVRARGRWCRARAVVVATVEHARTARLHPSRVRCAETLTRAHLRSVITPEAGPEKGPSGGWSYESALCNVACGEHERQ